MDPLNLTERNTAIQKFMALNGIILLLAMLAVYFFCSIPYGIIRSNLQDCESVEAKQKALNDTVTGITENVTGLLKTDEALNNTMNEETKGALGNSKRDYDNNVRSGLSTIRRDTSNALPSIVKVSSLNYIRLVDAFLNSRTTISSLNSALKENGIDATKLTKLEADKKSLEDKNLALNTQLMTLIAAVGKGEAAGGGGGGGGGDLAALKNTLKTMQAENAELSKKAKDCEDALNRVKDKTGPPSSGGAMDEGKRAEVFADAADYLYQRALKNEEKRVTMQQAYLYGAREILNKVKNTYQNKEAWKQKSDDVEKLYRRVSNM